MTANTHTEPLRSVLRRVDWWGVVSLLILGTASVLGGWVVFALAHFVWRHWIA